MNATDPLAWLSENSSAGRFSLWMVLQSPISNSPTSIHMLAVPNDFSVTRNSWSKECVWKLAANCGPKLISFLFINLVIIQEKSFCQVWNSKKTPTKRVTTLGQTGISKFIDFLYHAQATKSNFEFFAGVFSKNSCMDKSKANNEKLSLVKFSCRRARLWICSWLADQWKSCKQ